MFKIGEKLLRKMDSRGRVTIGESVLKDAGIPKDSLLQVETEKGKIVISVVEIKRGE